MQIQKIKNPVLIKIRSIISVFFNFATSKHYFNPTVLMPVKFLQERFLFKIPYELRTPLQDSTQKAKPKEKNPQEVTEQRVLENKIKNRGT